MGRKKILWITSWYPHEGDPFVGDFIQRHARAVALEHQVHLIYVTAGTTAMSTTQQLTHVPGLTEQIIYFPEPAGFLSRVRKQLRWHRANMQAVKAYLKRHGRPDLVHVHIPWKSGLIALELKKRWGLRYVVTEHWGIYNDRAPDNFLTQPTAVRRLLRLIFRQSSGLHSVSRFVGEGIRRMVVPAEYTVIPNVVDTELFYPAATRPERFTFLHVSNMAPLKQVDGIIQAFAQLHRQHPGTRLVLVGPLPEKDLRLADSLQLPAGAVEVRGEVPYAQVAEAMRQAHCLLLNSLIENAPCVISEAHCCGLPVVAPAVGGIPELVDETNGILFDPQRPNALLQAMEGMLEKAGTYTASEIALQAADRYSPRPVATAFTHFYDRFT